MAVSNHHAPGGQTGAPIRQTLGVATLLRGSTGRGWWRCTSACGRAWLYAAAKCREFNCLAVVLRYSQVLQKNQGGAGAECSQVNRSELLQAWGQAPLYRLFSLP